MQYQRKPKEEQPKEAAAETLENVVKAVKENYYPSDIDWKTFGREAEDLCKKLNLPYYIKDGLREAMEK